MCEIEDRVANANGRFPCKYCNQNSVNQFMQWAMKRTHAKKSKSNKTKTKIKQKVLIHWWTKQKFKIYLWTIFEIKNEIMQEVFDSFMDQTNNQQALRFSSITSLSQVFQ